MIHENFSRVQSYTRLGRVFDKDYCIPKIHKHSEFTSGDDNKLINGMNITKNIKRNISYFRKQPIGLIQGCSNIIINDNNNNKLNNFYYKTRSLNTNFVNIFKKAIAYNKDIIPNYLKCIQTINTSLNSQSPQNFHKSIFSTSDFELSNENTTIDYNDNIKTIKFKSFTKSPQNRIQREKVVIQTERNPRNITLETEVNNTKFKLSNSNKTFDNNNNFPVCPKLSVTSAIKDENEINIEEQKKQLIQNKMKIYESKLIFLFYYY
jgi:hypothetical protein